MNFKTKLLVTLVALLFLLPVASSAAVVYEQNGRVGRKLGLPVHQWTDAHGNPRAVVLALHGLGSHGTVYDTLARSLVPLGFEVLAPDMRGFGRWYRGNRHCPPQKNIDFEQSYQDLTRVLQEVDKQYPTLPRYVVGESLGAVMALRLAGAPGPRIDGLVLASPPVAHHHYVCPRSLATAALAIFTPHRELDMSPYIKKYSSTDARVRREILCDSLDRNKLSALDLLKASRASKHMLAYAQRLPARTPVLILQGAEDRMLKPRRAYQLFHALPSSDKALKWYPGMGHVLLQTCYIKPSIERAVDDWLAHRPAVLTAYDSANKESTAPARHD